MSDVEKDEKLDVAKLVAVLSAIDPQAVKSELSHRTGFAPSEVDELVQQLAAKGLVAINPSSQIVLSPQGQSLRNRLVHSKTFRNAAAATAYATLLGRSRENVDAELDQLMEKLI